MMQQVNTKEHTKVDVDYIISIRSNAELLNTLIYEWELSSLFPFKNLNQHIYLTSEYPILKCDVILNNFKNNAYLVMELTVTSVAIGAILINSIKQILKTEIDTDITTTTLKR
jgi:hypothetical protein